jgi:hypothetical protein
LTKTIQTVCSFEYLANRKQSSKLVNGEQSGSQSGFSSQSSNPDAAPQQQSKPKQKGDGDDDDSKDDSKDGGDGGVGKFLGGRGSPIDPVTNEVESLPKDVPASAPVKKSYTNDRDDGDDDEHHRHSSPESSSGKSGNGVPSSAGELSPEQIAAIVGILNGGGAQKKPQVPGQDD